MSEPALRRSDPLDITPADAARRIEEWFRRGYVMFSDLTTRSTCLLPAGDRHPQRRAPKTPR